MLRERGPVSRSEWRAGGSLASAIDHAASRGVHHGSLHLRDIILSPDTVRITGFGIASRPVKYRRSCRPGRSIRLRTRPSDLYSLGAIAFEAVTGKRVSADSLKEFEAEHGVSLRAAFGRALEGKLANARDFAEALLECDGCIVQGVQCGA